MSPLYELEQQNVWPSPHIQNLVIFNPNAETHFQRTEQHKPGRNPQQPL